MQSTQTRRGFLATLSSVGVAGLIDSETAAAQEAPPEVTTIRLKKNPGICVAPLWREYDPEDAVRFYSLRLREAGMIKSTPTQIIPRGTDWRFLNELKRELKG